MFTRILTTIALCAFGAAGFAQTHTLSGLLRAADTGEELLFAEIQAQPLGESQTSPQLSATNEYGFYSLTLPEGNWVVRFSYLGYQSFLDTIELKADRSLDIELPLAGTELQEIVVSEDAADANVRSTEVSTIKLDMKNAKLIPVIFGEQDVLKTIQLLPGVSPSSEGNSGFFVRGGNSDQNLILLDEAPVYNASHLLGFFSVFNSDALKDVTLYKGGIPAQYGGRVSSVLDIRMKNGNLKRWEVAGGIGLIASRLLVEGPLRKDKGSILLSARRTYADLLLRAVNPDFAGTSLYFYDLNLKMNYTLGKKDRLFLSGYLGRDVFGVQQFGLDWGNKTATLRWNHTFSPKVFSNTSFIYSNFDYGFNINPDSNRISLKSGIEDFNLKQDYNFYPAPGHELQFGWQGIFHTLKPGTFTNESSPGNSIKIAQQQALEGGLYAQHTYTPSEKPWSVSYGLRLSSFSNVGAYTVKTYDAQDQVVSSTDYGKGDFYHTYLGVEPRVNFTYVLSPVHSIKASYNRNYQYLHQLSNSTAGSPTDLWIPSSPLVRPQIADQVAVGYFRNFSENRWEFSAEAYYKNLQNQVDYEDGAQTLLNADLEAEFVFGKGRSYGLELYLRRRVGKLTGWVSYTLCKAERQFEAINQGTWFSARQDRTHNISLVAVYALNKKLTLSGVWVYRTGDAVTFPTGKYEIDGQPITMYGQRNANRMPAYHRLDFGLTWQLADKKHWSNDLSFSIYNAYNRKNAFTITFRESETNPGANEAVRLALFGIVPSITWNFHIK